MDDLGEIHKQLSCSVQAAVADLCTIASDLEAGKPLVEVGSKLTKLRDMLLDIQIEIWGHDDKECDTTTN